MTVASAVAIAIDGSAEASVTIEPGIEFVSTDTAAGAFMPVNDEDAAEELWAQTAIAGADAVGGAARPYAEYRKDRLASEGGQ